MARLYRVDLRGGGALFYSAATVAQESSEENLSI